MAMMARKALNSPWTYGTGIAIFVCLLVLIALLAPRRDPTMVVVFPRSIGSWSVPPSYDTDRMRLVGTVLEPLCQRPERGNNTEPEQPNIQAGKESTEERAPSIATCVVEDGKVVATLRSTLVRGPEEIPVNADDVKTALERLQESREDTPSWMVIDSSNSTLQIIPKGISPELLLFQLSLLPVAWYSEGCDLQKLRDGAVEESCTPMGTGPFYIETFWSENAENETSRPGWAEFGPLRKFVADVVRLQRRTSADGIDQIVLLGINSLGQTPQMNALKKALDQGIVHLALDLDRGPEEGSTGTWSLERRQKDSVLVAAVNKGVPKLSGACFRKILNALRKTSRAPAFLRKFNADNVVQILPEPMGSLYFQPTPATNHVSDEEPRGSNRTCDGNILLLSNVNWLDYVAELKTKLEEAELTVDLDAKNKPGEEERKRKSGAYTISVLGLMNRTGQLPAYFFWDTLVATKWMKNKDIEMAQKWAEREAAGEDISDEMMKPMSSESFPLVAIAAPPSYTAISREVLGFRGSDSYLDAQHIGLRTGPRAFLILAAVIVLLVLIIVTIIGMLLARRVERNREELRIRFGHFHHELVSPMSTIKATASRLRKNSQDSRTLERAKVIQFETDHALAVAAQARQVFDRKWLEELKDPREGADFKEVIDTSTRALKARAAFIGMLSPLVRISVNLPKGRLVAKIYREAAVHLIRNLLDNALKYRDGESLEVSIAGTVEGSVLVLRIEDQGIGISDLLPTSKLFRLGHRDPKHKEQGISGSGFGLFLCKEICRMVGGEIRLVNNRKPTVFEVRLPLMER